MLDELELILVELDDELDELLSVLVLDELLLDENEELELLLDDELEENKSNDRDSNINSMCNRDYR